MTTDPRPSDQPLAGPGSETLDEYRRRLGGDVPRDPTTGRPLGAPEGRGWGDDVFIGPRLSDLCPGSLVAADAGCTCGWMDDGDGESGPHVVPLVDDACPLHGDDEPEPLGPAPRSTDPTLNAALGAYDSGDVFEIAFTRRHGVL